MQSYLVRMVCWTLGTLSQQCHCLENKHTTIKLHRAWQVAITYTCLVLEQHLCGKAKFPLYLRSISWKDIVVHGCDAHYNPDLSITGIFKWKLIHSLGKSSNTYQNRSHNQSDWMRKKKSVLWNGCQSSSPCLVTLLTNIPTLQILMIHRDTLFDGIKWNIEKS